MLYYIYTMFVFVYWALTYLMCIEWKIHTFDNIFSFIPEPLLCECLSAICSHDGAILQSLIPNFIKLLLQSTKEGTDPVMIVCVTNQ